MHEQIIKVSVSYRIRRQALFERVSAGEAGEGVISAAIAVLVMAFLGAAMWVGFNAIFSDTQGRISTQVNTIGG